MFKAPGKIHHTTQKEENKQEEQPQHENKLELDMKMQ
jgi:hypothetical protein